MVYTQNYNARDFITDVLNSNATDTYLVNMTKLELCDDTNANFHEGADDLHQTMSYPPSDGEDSSSSASSPKMSFMRVSEKENRERQT